MTYPPAMKMYVVFVDYGMEGWKIWKECDTFQEAFLAREEALGNGNRNVVVFKPVSFEIREAKEPSPSARSSLSGPLKATHLTPEKLL